MAAVAPPASDQSADLLQKLSLDSQSKDLEVTDSEKKPTAYQTLANGIGKPYERSTTPFPQNFVDPMMWYFPNAYPPAGYYSGGYPGSGNEWDNYNIYANTDGVEMPPGLYGDNGSLVYYHGYYPPYSAYHSPDSPIPTVGDDGQLYGPQNYQYPSYYQSSTPNGEPFSVNQADAPQKGVSTSTGAEQVPFHVDTAKMNQTSVESFGNVNGTNASKPLKSNQNSCLGANGSYGRGGRPKDGIPSPNPWLDGSKFPDGKPKHAPVLQGANFLPGKNQNLHPLSHLTGPQHHMPTFGMSNVGFIDRSYPNNRMYSQYAHSFRTGAGFGFNGYGARLNGRGWVDGKYKPRVYGNGLFGHGIGNVDGLNELKRGPRIKGFKNQKDLEPIASGEKEQNTSHGNDSEDNLSGKDLPESYPDAKFFIIKSYSEDDVHKSIKYGVWASTSNGNKKLDAAYHEAQTAGCPVFLFFSVNASGQFVGLAEMVGTVDFTKSVEYWQQDKWTGNFPVKWRIVKDIPNSLLKHIILENNENKPVTNSRDTQEVKFDQGIEILKIFKGHSSRTCILDDFGFYESRQRIMQERKSKHMHMNNKLVGSKKLADAVVTDEGKDGFLGGKSLEIAPSGDIEDSDPAAQESVDIVSTVLTEEPVAATGEPEKMPTIAAAAEDVSGNAC